MEFETGRLTLRSYRSTDVGAVLQYYSNPEVCAYLCHGPWDEAEARQKVEERCRRTSFDDGGVNLVVEAGGEVIGNIAAWFAAGREQTVELGWVFAADARGRGYATEAVQALLDDVVFAIPEVHRVIAEMDARNTASAALAERLCMRREAHFVADWRCEGQWTDTVVYALLRQDRSIRFAS
jgi:RimJ/RimL family protein N-acetyltransferase